MNQHELLAKARDVFAERGGAKYVLEHRTNKTVCTLGALNVAMTGDALGFSAHDDTVQAYQEVNVLLGDMVGPKYDHNVARFNNADDITKQDVLDLFDKAIVTLEEKVS